MIKRLAVFAAVLGLAACAPNNVGGLANNDPGPFPDNYEQIVKQYLHDTLKDPYSIQELAITKPAQVTEWVGAFRGGDAQAWMSRVSYNAKNSFGGYVGIQCYEYFFKAGALMTTADGQPMIADGC